jgi:membrane protease YdiL (CAAX protease family)
VSKFFTWVADEPTTPRKISDVITDVGLLAVVWTVLAVTAIRLFGLSPTADAPSSENPGTTLDWLASIEFFLGAAIVEEIIFRLLPLYLAWRLVLVWRLGAKSVPLLLVVAFVSSVLFGYVHGGLLRLPVQGASGIFLSLVYLKCGGVRGKVLVPLAASSITHFLMNMMFMALGG